ncbi:MAG: carboxymuconolactone decarboxylase family protein [Pseudomonadota bacterium]|nr:carboxymuconolactone decarboxylase [Pseudomonadales bacterium]MDY6921890.1 carboxymuconolactone decarboxylase family protein [Pseudomonadota bacterium]
MSSSDQPQVPPILPDAWDQTITDALGAFPRGLAFVQNGWQETGAPVRGTYMLGMLAPNPPLAKAFLTFNNYIASDCDLSTRVKELLILSTGWLRRCKYEFIMHVILGLRAGLTEAEIERVLEGPDAAGWSNEDAALLRAADELCEHARISDATWQALARDYSQQQLMDIVFVVGCYEIMAMAVLSFEVPMEAAELPLEEPFRSKMLAAFTDD